jgi:DNA-binding MarR family transcriptional regulator
MNAQSDDLDHADYAALLRFRTGLRQFLQWSAQRAREAGLTASQHQLLLAIRGLNQDGDPTIGDVSEQLLLRHHSAVGLVDRAVAADLVQRVRDAQDQRVVRLRLTRRGARALASLSAQHRAELRRLGSSSQPVWLGLD